LIRVELNRKVDAHHYSDPAVARYRYAHHSDFIRLERLVEEGGVYADMDTLFVRPLPDRLLSQSFVLGSEYLPGTLCNAFMMAEPQAEFGRRWLARMGEAFTGDWNKHSCRLPFEIAQEIPSAIHIEPPETFYPFAATPRGLGALLADCQPVPDSACSIHLWAHLWWSRSRTDFSRFHGGRITPGLIRSGATTLARAAQPFLPSDAPEQGEAWRSRLDGAVTAWGDDLKALAGISLFPLIRTVKPGFGRLNLARGHLAAQTARRRFELQGPIEELLLDWLIRWDEYNIFDQRFRADDVIVDVGAHIGFFSWACHQRGSRNIHAFEASAANFSRLRNHLGQASGVNLHSAAVFRSDRPAGTLRHSGPRYAHTGAGNVMFDGGIYDTETAELLPASASEQYSAPTIPLDEVLARFPSVKLLKLDCEGSEFPIVLTSKLLNRVEQITGEFHEIPERLMPSLAPEARLEGVRAYTIDLLADALRDQGFEVTVQSHQNGLGMFKAARRTKP
jgi:FkbM family methyltransferase